MVPSEDYKDMVAGSGEGLLLLFTQYEYLIIKTYNIQNKSNTHTYQVGEVYL